jgi:hypothetical protein
MLYQMIIKIDYYMLIHCISEVRYTKFMYLGNKFLKIF